MRNDGGDEPANVPAVILSYLRECENGKTMVKNTENVDVTTGEILENGDGMMVSSRYWSDTRLAHVGTFAEALAEASLAGIVEDFSEYGTGFNMIDKSELLGVDFLILEWARREGDFKNDYVFVTAVTEDDRKVMFSDGSIISGLAAQLEMVAEQRRTRGVPADKLRLGLMVTGGLDASDYTYHDPQLDKDVPARTYYLAR